MDPTTATVSSPVKKKLNPVLRGGATVDADGDLVMALQIGDNDVQIQATDPQPTGRTEGYVTFVTDRECTLRFGNSGIFNMKEVSFVDEACLEIRGQGTTTYQVFNVTQESTDVDLGTEYEPEYVLRRPLTKLGDPKIVVP